MALQRMYPTAHFCTFSPWGTGYGTHAAAGSWADTLGGADCYSYCDDLFGALNETNYGVARSSGSTRNNGRVEFTFGDPPLNVTIASLTLVAWLRTSSGNPVAIDSSPTISMFNYVAGGARVYQTGTQTVTYTRNRNTQGPTGSFQKLSYTWTTKPGGGAWTRAELLPGFKAGFECSASSGYGSGVDATTGGSSASMDWASVYLELDTTPSGLYVDPVRQGISHQLRMFRRALRTFRVDVPLSFGGVEPGDWVWSSHPLLPWSPGSLSWQQVPLYALTVDDRLSSQSRSIVFLDLRDQFASFWSPFRITGMDDQNSGLAIWHLGGGWSTTRNQVAYGQRPGDGLYQEVAIDAPLLTKDGLLIQGGSDKNWLLNSTFSQGSSDTFTSWTKTTSGSATVTQDTSDYLIDVSGYQRSAKTTTTAAAENCYIAQTVASLADTKLRVRAWYKNDSGADAYFIRVQRSVDSWYWNDSTPGWQAGSYDIRPTLSTSISRYTSEEIDVGVNITDVSVTMGHYATVATGANVGHIYAIELQSFTDAGSTITQWFRRDLLPTTNAAVTREKDQTVVANSPDFRVWSEVRGCASVDVTLLFSHADMADSTAFGVLMGGFDLYYVRTNLVSGAWYFSNGSGSASYATASAGTPTTPVAGVTYRISVRWTSEAEDEHGLTGQALDIWVDGVKGTGATGLSDPTLAADDEVTLGNDPGTTLTTPLDGYLTNLMIDSRCPTDAEMARM